MLEHHDPFTTCKKFLMSQQVMFEGFVNATATQLQKFLDRPSIEFDIPLLKEFVSHGPLAQPRLYVVTGPPQTYKTTFAVELAKPFLCDSGSDVIWIDADLKFPINLLRSRAVPLAHLRIASCRSSEEILFNLLDIEHQLLHSDRMERLRCIVVDGLNSSYWIDMVTMKTSEERNPCWMAMSILERFVVTHGITVIAVMQHLFDDDPWKNADAGTTLKLKCVLTGPQTGQVSCDKAVGRFHVNDDRKFEWM